MKKKFVLTLALVLMVAGTLVAATPVEVSGSFAYGYDFKFASGLSVDETDATAGELVTFLDFTGDFWKVSIAAAEPVEYHDEQGVEAKAEIYLDKALAEQGTDLGDLSITLHVGNGVGDGASSVLADKNKYRDGIGIAMDSADKNFGVTVKYAEMVEVYASADPTLKALPMVVGAKFMPLDGVEAAVGFTNAYGALENNAMAVSAKADVAALAGLDFALAATGEFLLDLGNEEQIITADVAGEYEGIGLWAAYQIAANDDNKLAAKASYETTIEDFTVSASFKADLGVLDVEKDEEFTIEAAAKYGMGGVTYSLGAKYEVVAETFTVTPKVSISF